MLYQQQAEESLASFILGDENYSNDGNGVKFEIKMKTEPEKSWRKMLLDGYR